MADADARGNEEAEYEHAQTDRASESSYICAQNETRVEKVAMAVQGHHARPRDVLCGSAYHVSDNIKCNPVGERPRG